MLTLYPYQQKLVSDIRSAMKTNKHILAQSPTGSGKTVMFSYMCRAAISKGKQVLILTDRFELLMQTGGTLKNFNLNPSYIQAGRKYINYSLGCYVAMTKTLKNRLDKPAWIKWLRDHIDLIIIDEAHRQEFNYLFDQDYIKDKYVIGFTATPRRSGKMKQLALDYDILVEGPSVKQLIQTRQLLGDDYFGVGDVDTSGIKYDHKTGDFQTADMFKRFNSTELYRGVVKNWQEIAAGTKTLVFCVNIEHAIQTCEEFQNSGIDARFLVSAKSTPKEPQKDATAGAWVRYEEKTRLHKLYVDSFGRWSGTRAGIVKGFKKGDFKVLINAGILTTGFDDTGIQTIIVNRATSSVSLWLQMVGRGSRTHTGKTSFNILDFGGNAARLGHYTQNRIWSLWHEKTASGGVPPVKDCGIDNKGREIASNKKGCKRMIMASTNICPFCGFMYPKKEVKEIELEGEMFDSQTRKAIKVKRIKDMDDFELFAYWKTKGHQTAWLWRILWFRGGEDKIKEFGAKFHWSNQAVAAAINFAQQTLNKNLTL